MKATRTTVVNDAARAMDALRRFVHALHSANARAQSSHRVTAARLFVLRQIALAPGISMTRLGQRTRSATSSVSEVVSRLVSEGLVERRVSTADGRRAELTLSRAGAIVARSAGETIQERLVAAYEALEESDRAALADLLEDWLAAAGLEDAAAPFFFTDS